MIIMTILKHTPTMIEPQDIVSNNQVCLKQHNYNGSTMYNISGISCLDILHKQNKCTMMTIIKSFRPNSFWNEHVLILRPEIMPCICLSIQHQWRPIKSQLLQFILTEPNYIYRPHKWKKQRQYFSNLG